MFLTCVNHSAAESRERAAGPGARAPAAGGGWDARGKIENPEGRKMSLKMVTCVDAEAAQRI